jgi:hypothetical protein
MFNLTKAKENKNDVVMEIAGILFLRPHKAQEQALIEAMDCLSLRELVKYRDSLYQDADIAQLRPTINMEDDI